MPDPSRVFVALLLAGAGSVAYAAGPTPVDSRQQVAMPDEVVAIMRAEMRDNLVTVNALIALLAEERREEAAVLAEERLGTAAMGKHRGTGMGPGRFMPPEMRQVAWGMHRGADEFADVARTGTLAEAFSALQTVTQQCVTCHLNYRVR